MILGKRKNFFLLYIVVTVCLLISEKATVNFGKQRNLQIIQLSTRRSVNNL